MATFQHPQIIRVNTGTTANNLNEKTYGTVIEINPFNCIKDPELLERFKPFIKGQREAAMAEAFSPTTGQFKQEVIVTKAQVPTHLERTDYKKSIHCLAQAGLWNKSSHDFAENSHKENEEQVQKDIIQPYLKNR